MKIITSKVSMHYIIFSVLFFLVYVSSYAQIKTDTLFIKGNKQTTKDSAAYFRIQTDSMGILYATDYDITDSTYYCFGYYKSFNPYLKEGHFIYYSDSGYVTSEGNYINNKASGLWTTYYEDGKTWYTKEFSDGKLSGILTSYYPTGELKRKAVYKDDIVQSGKCFTRSGKDTVYYDLYIQPVFKGGDTELIKYFQKNLKYPADALKYKLEGKVYVRFTVKKDGSVNDVKIVPGHSSYYLFNDAAVEFVKNMPKWSPGYIDGETKDFTKVIPVKFQLDK